MDNNNQGGNNNSTAFSAYNAQKNAAVTKAATNIATKIPGPVGTIAKAAKPIVNGAVNNVAAQNAAARANAASEEGETQGEQQQNQPTPLDTGKAVAKEGAKKAAKTAVKKLIKAHPMIIIVPVVTMFVILIFVTFVSYVYQRINEVTDMAIGGYESSLNFLSFQGFKDNYTAINDTIKEVASDHPILDTELLIATVNDSAFIPTSLYDDENYDGPDTDSSFDAAKNFIANKYSTHTFYSMKKDMLGIDTGDAGSMLNSIIGIKLNYECVPEADKTDNAKALMQYAYKYFLQLGEVYITEVGDNFVNYNIRYGDNVLSYHNQNSSFLVKEAYEYVNFLNNLPDNLKGDWASIKEGADACSLQYVKDANGTPIVKNGQYVPMEAQYSVEEINDYEKFYNYIKKVYVPVLYHSVWGSMNSEARLRLVNEVWGDIVTTRNDSYRNQGVNTFLTYNFDENGRLITNTIGDGSIRGGIYGGRYGSIDISNFSTSGPGTIALSWRQGGKESWASKEYAPGYTMRSWGCLITSIAKLMRLSGTHINSASFDPWTLAQVSRYVNGGNLVYNTWQDLVPNFRYVGTYNKYIESTSVNPSGQLEGAIQSNGHVNDKYYYVIYIEYNTDRQHGHYIAVVGKDANGLILSDPTYGPATYHLNDISSVINSTVRIKQYQVYEKQD